MKNKKATEGIPLHCDRNGGYDWIYKGKMKKYATCPDCKSAVKIPAKR